MIRNDTNLFIILVRHACLDKVLKYKTKRCFQINMKHVTLTKKFFKKVKLKFLIKKAFKKLIYAIAAFNVIIFTFIKKTVYFTDIIIYKDIITITEIAKIIEVFLSL